MKQFIWLLAPALAFSIEIARQPASQVAREGEQVSFAVILSETDPTVHVSWFRQGEEVAIGLVYTTPSLTLAEDGQEVLCMVQQPTTGQTLMCTPAQLRVLPPTSRMLQLEGSLEDLYQGADFSVDMEVRLYTLPTGGQEVYRESFRTGGKGPIAVRNGRFSLRLGEQGLASTLIQVLRSHDNLYAQFMIGTTDALEQLEPRLALTGMPFALARTGELLTGNGVPDLEAAIGTLYHDRQTTQLYVRAANSWVSLNLP